jgi:hypothetical protein
VSYLHPLHTPWRGDLVDIFRAWIIAGMPR